VITFAQLGMVAVLAVMIHDGLGETSTGFALAYAGVRALLVVQYIRAGRSVPEARPLTRRFGRGFAIAAVIWVVSVFVPPPWRWAVWALAVAIDFGTPIFAGQLHAKIAPDRAHLPERFGLFVIIVLGESIVSVAGGVAEAEWQWRTVLTAAAGFASAAGAWWLYFQRADPTVITRAVRGAARDRLMSYVYGYSHLLVFAGITAGGVGVQVAIEGASEPLSLPARIALCGGAAAALLGMDLITWAVSNPLPRIVLIRRALAGVGSIVLIALGGLVAASTLVGILAVLIIALTVVEGMESTEQVQPIGEERDLAAY
jgi:low temperature requirement protein LtrA